METELQQAERTAKAWLEWPAVNQVATLARVFLAQQARLAEVQEGAEEEMRQRDHYRAMWQAAESRLASVRAECAAKVDDPEPCDWHQDGMGLWQTDCGNAFEFNEDGPWMNGLKFCGYCGKKLVEVPYEPMPDDDEEAQP